VTGPERKAKIEPMKKVVIGEGGGGGGGGEEHLNTRFLTGTLPEPHFKILTASKNMKAHIFELQREM